MINITSALWIYIISALCLEVDVIRWDMVEVIRWTWRDKTCTGTW